jgi:dihydropteroate synthase
MLSETTWTFQRLSEDHHIMGILNVTPDSFSDGGQFLDHDKAFLHALQMIDEGADMIDIGGESTRPGSDPVSESLELDRVIPLIERLSKETATVISVDTCKANVAREAVHAGAHIINDISGMTFDLQMTSTAAALKVPVIIMHIQGTPKSMQINPHYNDVVIEVKSELQKRIQTARAAGIMDLIIDPGFGFGKRFEDNFRLLNHLQEFRSLGCPLLVGTSRKSFLGTLFDATPDDRLEGTLITNAWAFMQGATIFRVHDVLAVKRAIRITQTIIEAS